jgi:hypothetical protein
MAIFIFLNFVAFSAWGMLPVDFMASGDITHFEDIIFHMFFDLSINLVQHPVERPGLTTRSPAPLKDTRDF